MGRPVTVSDMAPVADELLADVSRSSSWPNEVDPRSRCSSPTAPRSCSTRSPPARSPARRTATRTPTCGTSPANLEGSKAASRRCGRSSPSATPPWSPTLDQRFAATEAALGAYRAGDGWVFYDQLDHDADSQRAQRQHQRAGRADQQGRGGRRAADDRAPERGRRGPVRPLPAPAARAGRRGHGRACWRPAPPAVPSGTRRASAAAGARAGRPTAPSRSTARTRPASSPRPQDRLHFVAFDVTTDRPGRAGRAAEGLDRGRAADDRRAATPDRSARSTASRTRRRTTPARRSACRRPG